jgi:calcineurin-like phosphoesterase family protein
VRNGLEQLPVVIVGDVHGDLERLFQALRPYPADEWHTVFVGDLVDYGMFGVGALRYARDRANTTVLIGNHEVAMLWALRDPARIGFWMSIGGHEHDLAELTGDSALQSWLRQRPALVLLHDGTLVQHCGHDGYSRWMDASAGDRIDSVVARARDLLMHGGEPELWDVLSARNVFDQQPDRLQRWLEATNSRRVVFGHTPHNGRAPAVYHGGKAINVDGVFSRSHAKYRRVSPIAASVVTLDALS